MSEEQETTGGTVIEEKREVVIPDHAIGFQHWPQLIIALILTSMVCCILWAEFTMTVAEGNQRVIDNLCGSIFTVWMAYMGYFAHTNFSSNEKTKMIAKAGPVNP